MHNVSLDSERAKQNSKTDIAIAITNIVSRIIKNREGKKRSKLIHIKNPISKYGKMAFDCNDGFKLFDENYDLVLPSEMNKTDMISLFQNLLVRFIHEKDFIEN